MKNKLFLLFIILIFGCNSSRKEKLTVIDFSISQADSLKSKLDTVDIQRINDIYADYKNNIEIIKDKYNIEDSVTTATVMLYSTIRKPVKNFISSYPKLKKRINYTVKQLNDLKEGYKNGGINDSLFEKYYEIERSALYNDKKDIEESILLINKYMVLYDSLTPSIKQIVSNLK